MISEQNRTFSGSARSLLKAWSLFDCLKSCHVFLCMSMTLCLFLFWNYTDKDGKTHRRLCTCNRDFIINSLLQVPNEDFYDSKIMGHIAVPPAFHWPSLKVWAQTAQLISRTSFNWPTQGYLSNYVQVGIVMQIQLRELVDFLIMTRRLLFLVLALRCGGTESCIWWASSLVSGFRSVFV